ncbi:MAG TPA: coenzyme F420-0:L-glutamate ligase [Candidatus Paceibacterota bacterium]|jgi:coenzyme F420-0:L-glutamate ligase|nr:coenzyme F420-0:L-glutamate ligase [Candidatus Paceibacterota bacterium]
MQITPIKTRIFKENENLINFILKYAKKIREDSVLIVTSKIVALAEGRTAVIKNEKTRENIIKKESDFAIRTKYTWLTIKDGMVMAAAGVDESNANGKIILLPKDSFKTASYLRKALMKHYYIKNLGIIISDSRLLPLRAGIVGVALGYAGFKGVRNYIGRPDLFGRLLKISRTDIADSLATSAVLLMGEGSERQPLALITGAPIEFVNKTNKKELFIDPKEDIYQPLFEKIRKIKL